MTALKGRGRVVETKATVGSLKFRTHSFIISLDLVITAWSSFHTDPTKLIIHPILYTSLSTHTHTHEGQALQTYALTHKTIISPCMECVLWGGKNRKLAGAQFRNYHNRITHIHTYDLALDLFHMTSERGESTASNLTYSSHCCTGGYRAAEAELEICLEHCMGKKN